MLKFPRKIIQAPLAGYSCAPFRKLAYQWGRPDFCYTEMLSAQHIYSGAQQRKRYMYKDPQEGLLCVQLAGDEPEALSFAAKAVVGWGADLIDLNCGCPQPKIRKKFYGSKLLSDSKRIEKLIMALKSSVEIPVLIKIRVDANTQDRFNIDVAKAIQDAGADAVAVHGRHWTHDYDVPVNYQEIALIKHHVTIPVIGNGDISDVESARKMLNETNCDAIMIARASVGQPWIFEKIYQELLGNTYSEPDLKTIGEIFLQHVKGLMALEGEKIALLQSRKLGKYYSRHRFDQNDFISTMAQVGVYAELESLVGKHFY